MATTLTFRSLDVNDGTIILEDIDLFHLFHFCEAHLLQHTTQLLVVYSI